MYSSKLIEVISGACDKETAQRYTVSCYKAGMPLSDSVDWFLGEENESNKVYKYLVKHYGDEEKYDDAAIAGTLLDDFISLWN